MAFFIEPKNIGLQYGTVTVSVSDLNAITIYGRSTIGSIKSRGITSNVLNGHSTINQVRSRGITSNVGTGKSIIKPIISKGTLSFRDFNLLNFYGITKQIPIHSGMISFDKIGVIALSGNSYIKSIQSRGQIDVLTKLIGRGSIQNVSTRGIIDVPTALNGRNDIGFVFSRSKIFLEQYDLKGRSIISIPISRGFVGIPTVINGRNITPKIASRGELLLRVPQKYRRKLITFMRY